MNEETLNKWVTQYETNKTLPSKKIPCTTEGCTTETTAFSSNLVKKVDAAGNVRAFLTGFKCRACRKVAKTTTKLTDSVKEGVRALKKQRTEELVKAATIDTTSEVSTEELMNVFAESENPF